jgi:hypothetical protein
MGQIYIRLGWRRKKKENKERDRREKCTSSKVSVWVGRRFCVVGRIFAGGRMGTFSVFPMLAG